MANITEVSQWESVIRQIENGEAATGGADGLANVQAKQLANRTQYLKSQISNINNDTALLAATGTGLNHNGIYRGKNLGTFSSISAVESFLTTHKVSSGVFEDLYLGDYFRLQDGTYNVEWEIAGFDTYYQKGDTAFTNHHIALIPKANLLTSKMNDTDDTTGGYYNSYMHQSVIPTIDTNLATILGNHLLARRALLSDAMNKDLTSGAGAGWMGCTTGWDWYTVKSCLMSEVAVYGSKVLSSSFHDIGEDCERLPIFQFKGHSYTRHWFWLRDVASASNFAAAYRYGGAYGGYASDADGGVRPIICVG